MLLQRLLQLVLWLHLEEIRHIFSMLAMKWNWLEEDMLYLATTIMEHLDQRCLWREIQVHLQL